MGSHRHSHFFSNYYRFSLLLLLLLALALVFHSAAAISGWVGRGTVADGKRLIGPGSSPPTCRTKCGRCWPCEPVHVPIQPGLSVPLEYYPEAWRCKCGNKFFMP